MKKLHSPGPQKLKENVVKMTVWDRNARIWRFDYDEDILLEGMLAQASWLAPNLDLSFLNEEEMVAWNDAVAHVVEDLGNGQGGAEEENQAKVVERVQENHDSDLPEREASPESGDFGNGRNQEHENGIEFRVQAQPGPSYSNHLDAMEEFDFDYDGSSESGLPQTPGDPHEQEQGPYEEQIGDGHSSRSRGDLDEDNKDEDQRVRNNETRRKLTDASLYSLRDHATRKDRCFGAHGTG